jgi:hypothetical protein
VGGRWEDGAEDEHVCAVAFGLEGGFEGVHGSTDDDIVATHTFVRIAAPGSFEWCSFWDMEPNLALAELSYRGGDLNALGVAAVMHE